MIGEKVGHYRIESKLGAGGMGAVYKAEDTRLRRPVALKFLNRELTTDEVARFRFVQEAQSASNLDHPNICTIYEIGETDDGQLYISMAYYAGETVKALLGRGHLEPAEAAGLALQAARGLAKAHAAGIVHRDIKPDNLMITPDGVVKILDFGVAKLSGATGVTQEGVAVGSVAYMAPEQIKSGEVDQRADVWSLGVVLYEMLTGKLPFGRATQPATFLSILTGEPDPVTNLDTRTTIEVEAVVARALAKKPEDRFQDMAAMAQGLAALAGTPFVPEATLAGTRVVGSPGEASIAVLPFADLSPERDQEYFCDGIAEELIDALARVEGLKVVSRTSASQFKGKAEDVRVIGRRLGVGEVLDGSVRKAGDRLRISVQLVDVADGFTRWTERFDREVEDVFAIQDEIARTVVGELRLKLAEELASPLVQEGAGRNLEAYNLYLRGRHAWNQRTSGGLSRAVSFFQEALDNEPEYARAYAGLADAFALLGIYGIEPPRQVMPKAREAASQALAIDDSLAEVYASLGCIKSVFDWNWAGAERDFRKAVALNPNYATAHHWYAVNCLVPTSRFGEARAELRMARELDPLSPAINATVGLALYFEGRFSAAVEEHRRTLEAEPGFAVGHFFLGLAYAAEGMHAEAVQEIEEASRLSGGSIEMRAALGYALGVAGRAGEARKVLEELLERRRERYVSPSLIAEIYAGLDDEQEALGWLERAFEERAADFAWFAVRPVFAGLRAEPRFQALREKVGLDKTGTAQATITELPPGVEPR